MSYFGTPLYPATPINQQAISTIVGTTTLGVGAATYSKQFMITGAGGYTITLPAIDGVNFPSQSFTIFNNSSALCNVITTGTDSMLFLGTSYFSIAILPGERFLVQNMVTAWVVALESASRTTTAPQFDSSIRTASTQFVQRALGNYTASPTLLANTTLAATDAGKFIVLGGAGFTLTLPLISTVTPGSVYSLQNGGAAWTIAVSSGDHFALNSATTTSLAIGTGDTVILVCDGTWWRWAGGSAGLGSSASFASSVSGTGYQKLPSGIIVQWGTATSSGTTAPNNSITFGLAYPTGVLSFLTQSQAANSTTTLITTTKTGATYTTYTASSGAVQSAVGTIWTAIGY